MEKQEIMALILAVIGICILTGIVKLVRGEEDEGSSFEPPVVTTAVLTTKTDYWDYLHEQQETTTETTATMISGEDGAGTLNQDESIPTDETAAAPVTEESSDISEESSEDDFPGIVIQASPN